MKSYPKRLLSSVLIITSLFLLTAFNPKDIRQDACLLQSYEKADCSEFVGKGAGSAENVILLIGDGMGIGQVYAGRVYLQGPEHPLKWEKLPHRGQVTTCAMYGITDSAASGSAMATGHKAMTTTISMDHKREKHYKTILEHVQDYKATGLVTNTNLWDATPAVFAAHSPSRSKSFDIARQMVSHEVDVMLGGGANEFSGNDEVGNQMERARGMGYKVVRTRDELKAVDPAVTRKLMGIFKGGSLRFEVDWKPEHNEPHLSEMAQKALEVLEKDERGMFLMIEGAHIDHACHKVSMDKLLGQMKEFDKTVNMVLDWQEEHPDTLVIITADHETGGIRVWPKDYRKGDEIKVWWTTALVPGYAGHSSQRVPIYARGPNASAVKNHMQNTEVFCLMKNAFAEP
ncbi:MAG: alkaline phosphatase [bacterium]